MKYMQLYRDYSYDCLHKGRDVWLMKFIRKAFAYFIAAILLLASMNSTCLGEGGIVSTNSGTMLRDKGDQFVGEWCDTETGSTRLTIDSTENGYEIYIYQAWGTADFQHSEWYMTGAYDAVTDSIISSDCQFIQIKYDEEGFARDEVLYTNGNARITYEDGIIYWNDAQKDAGAGMEFTNAIDIFLGYFRVANCTEYVSLRSSLRTTAPVITKIPLGTEVKAYLCNDMFYECHYQDNIGYVLSKYLEYSSEKAHKLTSEQLDYIKGALHVPRDIVVTSYDYRELDYSHRSGQRLVAVNLYSNDILVAGATLDADALTPDYDSWYYSETHVQAKDVRRQPVGRWSESDEAYLKGSFRIPWNVAAHCEVSNPYLWEAGDSWITSVNFYAGNECVADTTMEECLAGAAIASNYTYVEEERDILVYSPIE